MGIEHHLTEEKKLDDEAANKEESFKDYPSCAVWITNDGLLISWLLEIISEDVLNMIEETETTFQVGNH
ncbi:putative leucine-rich repeat receptor-like protein kinase [Cucumis melo var. makuwa]|uniref:Leucine-rich repeat receptor-like protein kinase n=1 Tax=Cucumis melo var. makuwa TaxID=1194695 RepID=A0A5D3BEQ5_CUCMM|nr:putative leucine-rich repeat receptor-like protein kinase [Cucumis melo var. makuwa]TYJ98290.1 putative leucine-rich repeat receptor-like protein kinase [Cucumis melo var. makuwa]